MMGTEQSRWGGEDKVLPDLPFWQQLISPQVGAFTARPLKHSSSPATIYRIHFSSQNGRLPVDSVICKVVAPAWPGDPHGSEREFLFYQHLRPRLGLPHPTVYYTGQDSASGYRFIVLADLAAAYHFPPHDHRWTGTEIESVLRSYAHLHAQDTACLPPPEARQWLWTYFAPTWTPDGLAQMAETLHQRGIWQPLPGVSQLAEVTLAAATHFSHASMTLVHHDIHPSNVALPHDLNQEAVIIDWEMAGWGLPEIDLVYLFIQPFQTTNEVNLTSALDNYWLYRQQREGSIPPAEERQARLRHAHALFRLSLLEVAHQRAQNPPPPGTFAALYWQKMYPLLYDRLRELT